MSSETASGAQKDRAAGALFDAEDYTTWCRRLYQHVPSDGSAHVLFDSTISEPAELLRDATNAAFGPAVSNRFVSVFGQGNGFLIDALARRYSVAPDQVVCATGATNAISMALRALGPDRRHVVVETPRLDLLHHLPRASGLNVGEVRRQDQTFDIDPEEFSRALRHDTGMVLLTNPHNPSGTVLSASRLQQLAQIADLAGALVLVDEVYSDLAREVGFVSAVGIAPNMISVNSLTKAMGLFSLRCGWILAAPKLARQIEAANARVEFGISKLAHAVAAHVLENAGPFDAHWRTVLAGNRPVLERRLAEMQRLGLIAGDIPESGCMYFPQLIGIADTAAFARKLWDEHRVLVAPGEYFGAPGHVRIGFGFADGRLDAGLGRLHEALLRQRSEARTRPPPRSAASR